ncbi:MAG TPA: RagB/SusD family nutrient uptake outer membrane protein [Puia sp.]|nr:RagB/SusD family nutrient uptake outer membrane protein [Puia sp.]
MKRNKIKYIALLLLPASSLLIDSCKSSLKKPPAGSLQQQALATKAGVDGLLIGAYSMLDGFSSGATYNGGSYTSWETSTTNWVYGGIAADDAYKGSNTTDQPPAAPIENHSVDGTDEYLDEKWSFCYNAIQRANDVIREVPLVNDGSLTDAAGKEDIAEAQFLRGVFHLEAAKMWRNVPYVSERVTYLGNNYMLPNPGPIWDSIEADFTAAMAVLPKQQTDVGRANFYAAEAFLAKTYMFDHQYAKAKPLLDDLINNGTTTSGAKYALGPFENNFDAAYRNNSESVFCVQMTTNDGSGGNNGDEGDALNYAAGPYTSCCGFYQPSYSLANAYKVDANGLPMFQTDPTNGWPTYDNANLKNDHGLTAKDAFTPATDALDPRIDWTLGRRGIPYLDWGLCGGETWSRGDVVPYNPIKNVFWHSEMSSASDNLALGWAANQGTAINYNLIRFPDVILWRAECEVEANDLDGAQADVNMVRNRMAAHPEYWVHKYLVDTLPSKGFDTVLAANYKIGLYGVGAAPSFASMGQSLARQAVYMERQLELAMEGHRFFDLQRWDGLYGGPMPKGYMAGVLNAYIKADTRISNPVLNGHTFTAGKNELYPIPQKQIDIENGKLKQNPLY